MEYNPLNVVIEGELQGNKSLEEGIRKLIWDIETTEDKGVGKWGWSDYPDYTIVKNNSGAYLGPEEQGMIGYAEAEQITAEEAAQILETTEETSIGNIADEREWQYKVTTTLIDPERRRFTDIVDLYDKAQTITENRGKTSLAKIYKDSELNI